MRILILTTITMIAFAANSILNRVAIVDAGIDPVTFGNIRLVSGALALAGVVLVTRKGFAFGGGNRLWGVAALLTYIFAFSIAYRSLDAGAGALVMFGVVQLTMFAAAFLGKEDMPIWRWIGAGVAFVGLCWLLWPGQETALPFEAAGIMALAGMGWGIYSLVGRTEKDATQATAMNFICAAPVGVVILAYQAPNLELNVLGVSLAVVSGVVTSGMGYALWYSVVPALGASRAAVAQLTVPVIAMMGGMAFLAEPLTLSFVISSILVLGGVALSMKR